MVSNLGTTIPEDKICFRGFNATSQEMIHPNCLIDIIFWEYLEATAQMCCCNCLIDMISLGVS